MNQVELYSAKVCPYAHRTRLVLLEKSLDFQLIEIDLEQKPEWFLKISPSGKVPLLKYGDDFVWESAIINEYLEEVFPHPALMPASPQQRAWARIWIDFANNKFVITFYKLLLAQEPEQQDKWQQQLVKHLRFMEELGISKLSNKGDYWLGENISLIDLTFYPWFERWSVLEHYRHLQLPAECQRLKQWWQAVSERDSVKKIANQASFYIQQYQKYANNTATGVTAQEMRDS